MTNSPEAMSPEPRPVVPPIYQSTTFALTDEAYADIVGNGGLEATWYSRFSNPTVASAARPIAELEEGEQALMTSSGMGAIATTVLSLCKAGDRIVAARELYGDTHDLFVRDIPELGITVDFVPVRDTDLWRQALNSAPVKLAYAETISNPQLHMLDIETVADLAHSAGALLMVDNTFASPAVTKPLTLGADIVVNSVTKFLSGHSDVIAGVVVTDEATARVIQQRIVTLGTCLDPHAAFLVRRGLATFGLRLSRQNQTAKELAALLSELEGIARVTHPSRPDYPQRELAERQCRRELYGAVVNAVLDGGDERVGRFMRALNVITEATSLGGVESLVSAPYNSSHFSLTETERLALDIPAGSLRLSVGLESPEVLIEDIEAALTASA